MFVFCTSSISLRPSSSFLFVCMGGKGYHYVEMLFYTPVPNILLGVLVHFYESLCILNLFVTVILRSDSISSKSIIAGILILFNFISLTHVFDPNNFFFLKNHHLHLEVFWMTGPLPTTSLSRFWQ